MADLDGDSILDAWEWRHGLNPELENNGDSDGDGLSDQDEYLRGTNPRLMDTDADGLPDEWEVAHNYNPLVDDATLDYDQNGVSGSAEFSGDPNFDTDDDMLPDRWERLHAFNPLVSDENGNGDIDGQDDADGDGRCNAWEFRDGYDPRVADNPVVVGPLRNLRATKTADGGLDVLWELGPDPLPVIKLYVQNRNDHSWRVYATLPPTATSYHAAREEFREDER